MALEHERIDLTTVVFDVAYDPNVVGVLSAELNRMTKPVECPVFVRISEGTAPVELSQRALASPVALPRQRACQASAGLLSSDPAKKGSILYLVGADSGKAALYGRLAAFRQVRFSADLDPVYFEELTSERRVVRYVRGKPSQRFERIPGKRAEFLDSTIYTIAARGLIAADPDRREDELASVAAPIAKMPTVIKSVWLNR